MDRKSHEIDRCGHLRAKRGRRLSIRSGPFILTSASAMLSRVHDRCARRDRPLNSRSARTLTTRWSARSARIGLSTGRPPHARVDSRRPRRGAAGRLRDSADSGRRRGPTAKREIKQRSTTSRSTWNAGSERNELLRALTSGQNGSRPLWLCLRDPFIRVRLWIDGAIRGRGPVRHIPQHRVLFDADQDQTVSPVLRNYHRFRKSFVAQPRKISQQLFHRELASRGPSPRIPDHKIMFISGKPPPRRCLLTGKGPGIGRLRSRPHRNESSFAIHGPSSLAYAGFPIRGLAARLQILVTRAVAVGPPGCDPNRAAYMQNLNSCQLRKSDGSGSRFASVNQSRQNALEPWGNRACGVLGQSAQRRERSSLRPAIYRA